MRVGSQLSFNGVLQIVVSSLLTIFRMKTLLAGMI